MKKFLLTGVALATLAGGPALSADLPRRAPVKAPEPVVYAYNWSGFYIGAHVGGGWSDKCFTFNGGADGCHDGDGLLAGGQLGFNWQSGQFVFGVEFSGSWADISGNHAGLLPPNGAFSTELDTILMLTGRVGVAFDRMLLYVTGGGAWVNEQLSYAAPAGIFSSDKSRNGWTIGAGIEYGIAPNWSIAAQYNYIDLGEKSVSFTGPGLVGFTESVDTTVSLATVRLNYRFGGGPVVARY
jgi:outer membrane immunogenic protein